MDSPYYEPLQYVGDSRLGARAVRLFDWSRQPDGLTQSRYPSRMEQLIPPLSLIWVLMVEDLARYAPRDTQTAADARAGDQAGRGRPAGARRGVGQRVTGVATLPTGVVRVAVEWGADGTAQITQPRAE